MAWNQSTEKYRTVNGGIGKRHGWLWVLWVFAGVAAVAVPAYLTSSVGIDSSAIADGVPEVMDEPVISPKLSNLIKEVKPDLACFVGKKLRSCDFLLNKDFKKNAKYYLCLFSASWCPPCRREMPRIAKTYAETLKDDPDIELIHFSRDRDDEKATSWANEHNVKFPVVGPNGGNPLDLHSSGIPHLFILKADGTLVEEGHPMRIFNEAKFCELKGEADPDQAKVTEREDTNSGRIKAKDKVAKALQECDFMLNKSYKKNAKYYLCLLSASWCPPCRREMPRIAKLYAEKIRSDRDIELIHFSCDRDEESAKVWATEHNVKFPVVAPDGGNPLDLECHGIPHLFILKSDGTLVEEGHPASLFTERKLRELK